MDCLESSHPGHDALCGPPMVRSTALSSMPVRDAACRPQTVSRYPGGNTTGSVGHLEFHVAVDTCTVIAQSAWCSCMRAPGLRAISTTRAPGCPGSRLRGAVCRLVRDSLRRRRAISSRRRTAELEAKDSGHPPGSGSPKHRIAAKASSPGIARPRACRGCDPEWCDLAVSQTPRPREADALSGLGSRLIILGRVRAGQALFVRAPSPAERLGEGRR